MLAFADRYDLILCPVAAGPARPHGTMNVEGEIDPTSFTTPHSLTGWPAATVRCGTSPEGLPICVQLVARPWRDDLALAAALRLEQELEAGGRRRPISMPADERLVIRTLRTSDLDEEARSAVVDLCVDAHREPDFLKLFS